MKANRKFRGSDEAVSPVIAVILMVAITVVLAATVYVWVSGFGSQSSNPAKTMALTSAGSIGKFVNGTSGQDTDTVKNYTVASASSGLRWSDVTFTLDGTALTCDDTWNGAHAATTDYFRVESGSSYLACDGSNPTSVVNAGQELHLYDNAGDLSGKSLRVLDTQANSVIFTLTIG